MQCERQPSDVTLTPVRICTPNRDLMQWCGSVEAGGSDGDDEIRKSEMLQHGVGLKRGG